MAFLATLLLATPISATAQGRGGPARPAEAKAAAPIDLTGYWVTLVTEEWRWRMVTPPKGDYASIPMTAAAKAVADQWDPAKDEAAGEQCKGYGAAAIMRMPGRLHITWEDNNTLRIDTDTGTQTRLLHFGTPATANTMPTWQGSSVAKWDFSGHCQHHADVARIFGREMGFLRATRQHGRPAKCNDNEDAPGIPPEERHSLQRKRSVDRILQSHRGRKWR
jgi:hypothetical protein